MGETAGRGLSSADLLLQTRHLEAINRLTVELAGAQGPAESIACICSSLRAMTGALAVALSDFDPAAMAVRVREVCAPPEFLADIEKIVGTRPAEIVNRLEFFPAGIVGRDRAAAISDLREVFFNSIPEQVADRLARELGTGDCYGLCLRCRDRLTATMAVVMPPGAARLPLETLEAFANVAAAGLWQKQAEAEIEKARSSLEKRVRERSTELAERNRQLEEAGRRLEELGRARDEFVASVSHDMRTPLVTGLGYLEMLADGAYGALTLEGASAARTALRNLRRLANLVGDVLEYQRLALRGELDLSTLRPVDLVALFRECAEEFLFRTGWSDDQVTIRTGDGLPAALADESLIRRALTNLLDNAGRHAGGLVHVSLAASLEPDGLIRVEVSDDGAGMPAARLSHAFEPLVGQAAAPGCAGSSMGLAIVRRICEAHGSAPQMLSGPGAGTRVWFHLRPTVERPRPTELRESESRGAIAGCRVLVVDDDRDTLDFVRLVLARNGLVPVTAASGAEAILAAGTGRFDLVLLDVTMPDMDGIELCRRIKSSPECAGTPVYMFSARAEDSARRAAIEAGCDGYIVKPVPVPELLRLVARACGDRAPAG